MKHTGTSMGGRIVHRTRQKGNRKCKNCIFLEYKPSSGLNYYCTKLSEPKEYTKVCYCKNYKAKD